MPCEEYEKLRRDWEIRFRAEILAHDGYKGSINATLAERSRTTSERIAAETRLANHTSECVVCKSDGKEPWGEVDPHQPFH
jgi:hypothetical protein